MRDILGGVIGDVVHSVVTYIDHQRLSLWESWREAPERARTLIKNFERGDGSL